jgi:hypothetical protein
VSGEEGGSTEFNPSFRRSACSGGSSKRHSASTWIGRPARSRGSGLPPALLRAVKLVALSAIKWKGSSAGEQI